jgi:uncharacterized membrane protein YdfJ with MMPL/SSD domain
MLKRFSTTAFGRWRAGVPHVVGLLPALAFVGFHSDGAVISWLPLFLFVVLFGLSMDYHVFSLGRAREGVDAGMSTDEALATASRARPWSSAAPRL